MRSARGKWDLMRSSITRLVRDNSHRRRARDPDAFCFSGHTFGAATLRAALLV
jgi:hypothetical protein